MNALEQLRAGDVTGAVEKVKSEVRQAPRDPRLRTFLFQLFCITGAYDRALTQLTTAAELDPLALPMAQTYRAAIRCEILRERVFAGATTPTVFGAPEPWMSLLIEANRRLAAGAAEDAAGLRDAAFEQAPGTHGTLNGEAFTWIADADPRLGPMLEAIIEGRYVWVPFHRIARMTIEAPADLRDQVWMPASFIWSNGGETAGLIPTRYPGSAASADGAIQLGRRTEWNGEGDWFLGLGQRMLATDAGEYALQDIRSVEFAAAASEASQEGAPLAAAMDAHPAQA